MKTKGYSTCLGWKLKSLKARSLEDQRPENMPGLIKNYLRKTKCIDWRPLKTNG